MDKLELFQKTYEAISEECEFEPYFIDGNEVLGEEYKAACKKSSDLFREVEDAGLIDEYMDWLYNKMHIQWVRTKKVEELNGKSL